MRKQLKQYGIYGMAEQTMLVSLGGVQFKVSFAHGCMTTLGVKPAVYSTDNYVIQTAIEQSPDFKSGIIKLVRTTDMGEEVYTGPSAAELADGPEALAKPCGCAGDEPGVLVGQVGGCVQSGANCARHGVADGCGCADAGKADEPLSFDTLDLAKQWLEKTVGVSSANCRRSEIVRIARDNGFTITIK